MRNAPVTTYQPRLDSIDGLPVISQLCTSNPIGVCRPFHRPVVFLSMRWNHMRMGHRMVGMPENKSTPDDLLGQAARQLGEAVAALAAQLHPFPSFMGMSTLQAIELEPPPDLRNDWGCVVVLPDGEICELELELIPGPAGPTDVDQVDRYKPLELSAEDYIHFAAAALRAIAQELSRRGTRL